MGILGGFPVGGGRIAEGFQPQKFIPAFYSDSFGIPYRYELRDTGGNLRYMLPKAYGVQWIQQVNQADWIQLSYPGNEDLEELMVHPYEIWVYEGDNTDPSQKFVIRTRTDHVGESHTVTVTGDSYLHQLLGEWVTEYTPASGSTVNDVVNYLMDNFQANSNDIQVVRIDNNIAEMEYCDTFRSKTLLRCLLEMVERYGGYLWVDGDRRLYWQFSQGIDHGHVVRVGKNALNFQRTLSYDEYVDRIIAYGYGLTEDSRISVTVGPAVWWVCTRTVLSRI